MGASETHQRSSWILGSALFGGGGGSKRGTSLFGPFREGGSVIPAPPLNPRDEEGAAAAGAPAAAGATRTLPVGAQGAGADRRGADAAARGVPAPAEDALREAVSGNKSTRSRRSDMSAAMGSPGPLSERISRWRPGPPGTPGGGGGPAGDAIPE